LPKPAILVSADLSVAIAEDLRAHFKIERWQGGDCQFFLEDQE
jgi:hypothetical protein